MRNLHTFLINYLRYWFTHCALMALKLATHLPWRIQMLIGKLLGLLMYYTLKQRRRVTCINIQLAFPALSPTQQKNLVKAHFISLGQGLLETGLSWWGNEQWLSEHSKIEGLEHLQVA